MISLHPLLAEPCVPVTLYTAEPNAATFSRPARPCSCSNACLHCSASWGGSRSVCTTNSCTPNALKYLMACGDCRALSSAVICQYDGGANPLLPFTRGNQ